MRLPNLQEGLFQVKRFFLRKSTLSGKNVLFQFVHWLTVFMFSPLPLVMLVLSKGRKVSDRGYTATGLFIPSPQDLELCPNFYKRYLSLQAYIIQRYTATGLFIPSPEDRELCPKLLQHSTAKDTYLCMHTSYSKGKPSSTKSDVFLRIV